MRIGRVCGAVVTTVAQGSYEGGVVDQHPYDEDRRDGEGAP
jgi:hypothetical protein